jgi:uncharacterized protein YbjT (DUF2867 family)
MILIVGANGNVGSEVVKQLATKGESMRALVRDPAKATAVKDQGIELVQGDLSDAASLQGALKGVDKVFVSTTATPYMTAQHIALINAAKEAGVDHLVKISVFGAGDDPTLRIARWHHLVEQAAVSADLPYTMIRPNGFMQNILMQAQSVQSGSAFYAPMQDAKVSFADIRDIAACAVETLTGSGHKYKTYEITGSEALSHADLAKSLTAAIGKDVSYVDIPSDAARKSFTEWGLPDWMNDVLIELYGWYTEDKGSRITGDAKTLLGRDPISFGQFAKDHAAAFSA